MRDKPVTVRYASAPGYRSDFRFGLAWHPGAPTRIENDRKDEDGMRAKADMEVLIDTSPVGVIVFDARSGQVVACNGELNRIAGDIDLRDRSIMELLDAVAVRRADGRRIEQEEYQALVGILREARTVRSEEIIHE